MKRLSTLTIEMQTLLLKGITHFTERKWPMNNEWIMAAHPLDKATVNLVFSDGISIVILDWGIHVHVGAY